MRAECLGKCGDMWGLYILNLRCAGIFKLQIYPGDIARILVISLCLPVQHYFSADRHHFWKMILQELYQRQCSSPLAPAAQRDTEGVTEEPERVLAEGVREDVSELCHE